MIPLNQTSNPKPRKAQGHPAFTGGITPLAPGAVLRSMNNFPPSVSKGYENTNPDAQMPAVQFKDELFEAFDRSACLPELWAYVASVDFRARAAFIDLLKEVFWTHARTELLACYATHTHKERRYILSEVNPATNRLLKVPFRSFLGHPSDLSLRHTHSLFLSGSVTHTTKGDNPNDDAGNRLPNQALEGARRQALQDYRPFAGDGASRTFRKQALRPCFSHYPADRPNESGQGYAMGMGSRDARPQPQGPGTVAPCLGVSVVHLPGPRPKAILRMYFMENLVTEEDALWEEAA